MNLRGIASRYTSAINPLTQGSIQISNGNTVQPDGTRLPSYAAPVTVPMQVQSLTQTDIFHLDGLNIQGATHAIYLNGKLSGIVRSLNEGGDLVQFRGQTWLVKAVLEAWPDWTKAAVILQDQ